MLGGHRRAYRETWPLAMALALAGCDGCPGSKPYTPYTLDAGGSASAAPSGAPVVEADASAPDAGSFAIALGTKPPGDGKSWPLEGGKTVPAPSGRTFEIGFVIDADAEGARDLVAWASAPDRLRGELWFAAGDKPEAARTIVAMPADLSARGCTPTVGLAQVGARTVTVDVSLKCAERAKDHPSRWVAVVRLGDAAHADAGFAARTVPELGMEVRVASLPPDEGMAIAIDGSDRDGDGRDDVSITTALAGAVKPFSTVPPAGAILRYYDRPTGFSRDPAEPGASLAARAAAIVADAKKKSAAAGVVGAARQLRALRDAICTDASNLVTVSAGPTQCGSAGLDDLVYAEALAALTLGDPARALAAQAKLEALSPAKGPRKKELEKSLGKLVSTMTATSVRTVTAVPAGPRPPAPSWGPLAFEASGDLLVRTDGGVVRVEHGAFGEATVEGAAWPIALGPAGWQLAAIEQRCDEPSLVAVASVGSTKVDVPLPVLAQVGADGLPRKACAALPGIRATPLGASSSGFVLAIGGELVGIGSAPGDGGEKIAAATVGFPLPLDSIARGAGRSPDGSTVALPMPGGILVWTAGRGAVLWTAPELAKAWGCAPSSGAGRLACVVDKSAMIFETPGH